MTKFEYTGFQRTQFSETMAMLRSPEFATVDLAASIIIVNYNGWLDLERCLVSLRQSEMSNSEVIVIDNCSTDDSRQKNLKNFPYVRLIRSSVNLGFGEGNNLGARLAQGRVLVFLNPDTMVEPGWLAPLLNALDEDPKAGMATARILLLHDPARINTCGNNLHLSGLAQCRGIGQLNRACKLSCCKASASSQPGTNRNVAAISGAAFAIRKELFDAVGGFDEAFFLYMEDTDLSVRLRIAGYRIAYVPESVVYHNYSLTFGPMKTYYQERNRYQMLLKNLHWCTLAILLPALILAEAVTWGFVLLRDRANIRNKLFAYAWILYWWREIMQKRAVIQKQRRASDRSILRETTARLDFAQTGGSPWIARLAHLVFDPLFTALRWSVLALVWW